MVMAVDEYFKHMEKVVLGDRFVPMEREDQFIERVRVNKKGKGLVCPFCGVGFWGKREGKAKCPDCDNTFTAREKI